MAQINKKERLVCGIGINDADYFTQTRIEGKQTKCPFYETWSSMLKRCYSKKSLVYKPTYKDCTVCEEWLIFSAFKAWMEKQDWKGKSLDKDIMVQGNKIYSPENCIFVTADINKLFVKNDARRGLYKLGVSFHKRDKVFSANCSVNSKSTHIGYYSTEDEAYEAYKLFKTNLIREIANEQTDERLKNAMLNYVVE